MSCTRDARVVVPDRLLQEPCQLIVRQIEVIGISGHSLGVVPMDARGELLRDSVPIWSDSRPDTQPAAFFEQVPEEQWYNMTGNGFPPPLYSIFKLMWFRQHELEMFGSITTVTLKDGRKFSKKVHHVPGLFPHSPSRS